MTTGEFTEYLRQS